MNEQPLPDNEPRLQGEPLSTQGQPEPAVGYPEAVVSQQTSSVESSPAAPLSTNQPAGGVLQWQASEYVMREKNNMWFIWLWVGAVGLIVVAIFLLKNWLFALLLLVMAIAVSMFARRPAHDMNYRLSYEALMVNDKSFRLDTFRAFGLLKEGGLYSILLIPVKRFSPGVNVYFPPDMGEAIIDILGTRLPMEEIEAHVVDQLSEKLRF
jgi:hypothetical protein